MDSFITLAEIDKIAEVVRQRIKGNPKIALILGSGLGALAEAVEDPTIIPYGELPNWPVSTVIGHEGSLVVGKLRGQEVIVMQGRVHYYEGYTMDQVALPVRVLQRLGVEILVVTNAAGAINPAFEPGDLMLITDHLNIIGMAGPNPLRGPNFDELRPTLPRYEPGLRSKAQPIGPRSGPRKGCRTARRGLCWAGRTLFRNAGGFTLFESHRRRWCGDVHCHRSDDCPACWAACSGDFGHQQQSEFGWQYHHNSRRSA